MKSVPDTFSSLDPLIEDENDNSRIDSEDDFDGDGLTNLDEQIYNTDANISDSDGDGGTSPA